MGENEIYPGLRRTGRIWAESDYAKRASPVDEECMRKGTAIPEREGWCFFPGIKRLGLQAGGTGVSVGPEDQSVF